MVFHVTVWYCMALYFVTFYCIVFCVIARCYMLLHWYCIILYCILWYCMVLQCIAWHQSIIYFWGKSPSYIVVQSHHFTMISSFVSLFYMGGSVLTMQSLILMSYFFVFLSTFFWQLIGWLCQKLQSFLKMYERHMVYMPLFGPYQPFI